MVVLYDICTHNGLVLLVPFPNILTQRYFAKWSLFLPFYYMDAILTYLSLRGDNLA